MLMTKVLLFLTFMSLLNIMNEWFIFYKCFKKLQTFELSNSRKLLLWFSISYILTIIFSGIC